MHVTFDKLTQTFQSIRALIDLSLEIPPGKVVAVLGPSGSGKSTMLRCLGGMCAPVKGEIRFDQEPFKRTRIDLRRKFIFVPDTPLLFPDITLLDHVSITAKVYNRVEAKALERARNILSDYQCSQLADVKLKSFSRPKGYIAALTILGTIDPELWIVDEPFTAGLDSHAVQTFSKHVKLAGARGKTVVYSTRDIARAERLSDLVCLLRKGRCCAFDSIGVVKNKVKQDVGLSDLFEQLNESKEN